MKTWLTRIYRNEANAHHLHTRVCQPWTTYLSYFRTDFQCKSPLNSAKLNTPIRLLEAWRLLSTRSSCKRSILFSIYRLSLVIKVLQFTERYETSALDAPFMPRIRAKSVCHRDSIFGPGILMERVHGKQRASRPSAAWTILLALRWRQPRLFSSLRRLLTPGARLPTRLRDESLF